MSLPALSEWLHVAMTELCFGELVKLLTLFTQPLTLRRRLLACIPHPLSWSMTSDVGAWLLLALFHLNG